MSTRICNTTPSFSCRLCGNPLTKYSDHALEMHQTCAEDVFNKTRRLTSPYHDCPNGFCPACNPDAY